MVAPLATEALRKSRRKSACHNSRSTPPVAAVAATLALLLRGTPVFIAVYGGNVLPARTNAPGIPRHGRGGFITLQAKSRSMEGATNVKPLSKRRMFINDGVRNTLLIGVMGGAIAASWWFTGKWWKLPMIFALPSMVYRLWITRGDTEKLASVSASVDMKYVASSAKEKAELKTYMCSGCGYTLFPARGREAAFFSSKFKCPMCGTGAKDFFDMSDDSDDGAKEATAPVEQAESSNPKEVTAPVEQLESSEDIIRKKYGASRDKAESSRKKEAEASIPKEVTAPVEQQESSEDIIRKKYGASRDKAADSPADGSTTAENPA